MKSNLIIAEDNLDCIKNIYNMIKIKNLNVEVVGITTDGEETIKLIDKINPNILILDLKMPKKNGLNILNEIKDKEDINIIITSGEIQMINKINKNYYSIIKNIFIKPFDYDVLCSSIDSLCKISEKQNNKELINELLHNFEFNFSSLFYQYLILCIDKIVHNTIPLKNVFKEVSTISNKDCNRIKWGIEKLMTSMIRYTPKEKIHEFFPYTNRPSTKTFIITIANIVKKKNKN